MSDGSKSKKLRKENKKLRKELSDLRRDFIDIQKKVKKIKKSDKKRKRKEKKDKGPEKKKGKVFRDEPGLTSLQTPPPPPPPKQGNKKKATNSNLKKVKVKNPFTNSNNKLMVSDASYKNNRHVAQLVNKYRSLADPDEKAKYKKGLAQIFSDAMLLGVTEFEKGCVPPEILNDAIDLYEKRTGNKVTVLSETSSSSSSSESESEGPIPINTFQGKMEHYQIVFPKEDMGKGFMETLAGDTTKKFEAILMKSFKKHGAFKFYADLTVLMGRGTTIAEDGTTSYTEEREVKLPSGGEKGGMLIVTKKADVYTAPGQVFRALTDALSDYSDLGSGFVFLGCISLDIYVSKQLYGSRVYNRGSPTRELQTNTGVEEAGNWLPLPKWLTNKYAIINPQPPSYKVDDNRCFEWCVLRAKHPWKGTIKTGESPRDCTDLMEFVGKEVKLPDGIDYPIPLSDSILRKIEEVNDFSFSIFALGKAEGEIRPIYLSELKEDGKQHIHLGVLSDGDIHHFVYIKNLSGIINDNKWKTCQFYCERCLSTHKSKEALNNHMSFCGKHEPCQMRLPEIGSKEQFVTFDSWHQLQKIPFVIYADFECILTPNEKGGDNHIPSCFCYHIKCSYPHLEIIPGYEGKPLGEPRIYTGKDCMNKFFESLFFDTDILYNINKYTENKYSPSKGDREKFQAETDCHICRKPLGKKRHFDHDHFTGLYRGASHPNCNLKYTTKKMEYIPCVIHNLKGYDGYNILAYLHEKIDDISKLEVIAKNLEKFTCMTINHVRFIDSIQFINGSLEAQVNNLRNSLPKEDRSRFFPEVYKLSLLANGDLFNECMMKGVYPYEWMDSFEKMDIKKYPKKEVFFSRLSNEGVSDEEYARGLRMWKGFGCKTMKDYTELYCKLDVLLLESLFEAFRSACLSEKGSRLDPAHFVTAPSLSWAAMLLMNYQNDIELENMTDMEMFLMVENGIRGGMCQVMNPYACAHKGEPEDVGDSSTFSFSGGNAEIVYLDANNLYGWAMSQLLPVGDYRWEYNETHIRDDPKGKEKESIWETCDVKAIYELPDDGERGYILEVDLHIPESLHDYLNDYPPCPEPKIPTPSLYTQAEMARLGILSTRSGSQKLVCDLLPKKKYVIHYRNLKQCLELGVKLDKIHRVISFYQSDWLARYIDYNTQMRKLAKNKIDQDFYKLMNNSVFGKTMEDFRKRRKIQFYTEKNLDKALKDASSPWCKHWRIITEDKLMIMEMARHSITFTRPIIIGMCILDLSKLHMFNFHYKMMKPTFGRHMMTLYTDTDSLVYLLSDVDGAPVEDILVLMQEKYDCFDLSEMSNKEHGLMQGKFDPKKNARVLGKMKDELGGHKVREFIALRSKMYSFEMESEHKAAKNKAKGIPGKAVNEITGNRLCHRDYVRSFEGGELESVTFTAICHDKTFKLETRKISKVGLSACDDKSHYFDAGTCLRYGHHMIEKKEKETQNNLKFLEKLTENEDEETEYMNFITNELEILQAADN